MLSLRVRIAAPLLLPGAVLCTSSSPHAQQASTHCSVSYELFSHDND